VHNGIAEVTTDHLYVHRHMQAHATLHDLLIQLLTATNAAQPSSVEPERARRVATSACATPPVA
jgi:hypothetical protein